MLGVGGVLEYLNTAASLTSPRARPSTAPEFCPNSQVGVEGGGFWLPGHPGRRYHSLKSPTAREAPAQASFLTAGLVRTPALRGGKRTAQVRRWWEGQKLQPSREPWVRGPLQPEGAALADTRFLRRVPHCRANEKIKRGPPEAARGDVPCRPMPCPGPGPRLRLDCAGCGRGRGGTRRAGSPRPGLPCAPLRTGRADPAGRVGPMQRPISARGGPPAPSPPPARPAPDSPAWRRQNPRFAAASGARLGPASRREAAPRRRLYGPPRSAPPAHFPQEMINSGRGAFPWQPAPTRRGAAVRVSTRSADSPALLRPLRVPAHSPAHPPRSRAPSRAPPRTLRAPAHSHALLGPLRAPTHSHARARTNRPLGVGAPRSAHTSAHVRSCPPPHTHAHTFTHGLTHRYTRPSHMLKHIPTLVCTYLLLHLNLL